MPTPWFGEPIVPHQPILRYTFSGGTKIDTNHELNYPRTILNNVLKGRGVPYTRVFVHIPNVYAGFVGVDGAGNWALGLPRELNSGEWIHVYQEGANGRPNSGTISTSVVNTLLLFQVTILN